MEDVEKARMWEEINKVQQGQASLSQGMLDLVKSTDLLRTSVERSSERQVQQIGESNVKLASAISDLNALGDKVRGVDEKFENRSREHKEEHRSWATMIIGILALIFGAFEFIIGYFRKGS